MKANELMIGDYVEHIEGSTPIQIEEIHTDGVIFSNVCYLPYDEIKPIPLTEEILIKNGFGYIEKDYDADGNVKYTHTYLGADCLCDNVDLHIGINNNGVFCVRWMHSVIYGLQFVHELQHAFHLMCIKREIEL